MRAAPIAMRSNADIQSERTKSAQGHERRFRDVHATSGVPPTPERLRHRSELTLRANCRTRSMELRTSSTAPGSSQMDPEITTVTLWRPVGPKELGLNPAIRGAGLSASIAGTADLLSSAE